MREDWDARARENAMYYIDTRRESWEVDAFFGRGKEEALALVQPVLERFEFKPAGKHILEIGCGIGRLFPGFAELFDEIWGVDISAEMVRQGYELCPVPHARFVLGNGEDLSELESEYFDYCFSYIVFQHIPDPDILWKYLDEVYRVLKPAGAFQLHFRASSSLKSKVLRRLPESLRFLAQRFRNHHDPGQLITWTGVAVSPQQVTHRLSQIGFTDVEVLPCSSFKHQSFWAIGRKPLPARGRCGSVRARQVPDFYPSRQ